MPSTLDDYKILETIGTGSYGTCRKIQRRKDKRALVWKELFYGEMNEGEKQMLVSEVNLLRELRHDHIVRYYDRIIDRSNSVLYIIMEYCKGGDLAKLITESQRVGTCIEEDFIWRVGSEMISALKYCHLRTTNLKKILHRDLKPANVFLDAQRSVKLGDFGLARVLSHDTSFAKTFVGTPYYMSPEQMNFQRYNEKSDIWSLGVIMYELCALRPPFTGQSAPALARNICTGLFPRIPSRYSEELHRFISRMLKVDESKRPSIEELSKYPKVVQHLSPQPESKIKPDVKPVVKAYVMPKPTEDEITKRLKLIEKKELELSDREFSLKDKEHELRMKERQLERRERSVMEREEDVRRAILRRPSTGTIVQKGMPLRPIFTENTKDKGYLRQRKGSQENKENEWPDADGFLAKRLDRKLLLRHKSEK